jgi:hypothetical protein
VPSNSVKTNKGAFDAPFFIPSPFSALTKAARQADALLADKMDLFLPSDLQP